MFAWERQSKVPGHKVGSLNKELKMTPGGVLRWDDLASTTASSEVVPLLLTPRSSAEGSPIRADLPMWNYWCHQWLGSQHFCDI